MPPEPPERRLALILSGAVSLGSFEAGVLDELLYAVDWLAEHGGPVYRIDVMTGASAGAMTAALVARALVHDIDLRRRLREAWVDRIDIRALTTQIPPAALLAATPIDEISRAFLLDLSRPPGRISRAAPDTLRMTFMLSNMNGVDFSLPVRTLRLENFTSTFHSERRRFELRRAGATPNVDDPSIWARMREAAVCSGNFPIAFLPRMMDYDPAEVAGMSSAPPAGGKYCYVDGGLFNNEPIREAVAHAAVLDGGAVDPSRKFLLVDANLNRSGADAAFSDRAPLLPIALRVVRAVLDEIGANDLLRADRVNNEVGWRDDLVAQLGAMVRDTQVADPAGFEARLRALALGIVQQKKDLFPDRYPNTADAMLDAELARIGQVEATRVEGLNPRQRSIFGHLLYLLNAVAGLSKKSVLDVDLICAEPGETAGDRLFNFGGFFQREWREHDYRIGRRKAADLLPGMLGFDRAVPREPGPGGEDLYTPERDYSAVELRDAGRRERELLRDATADKLFATAQQKLHLFWPVSSIVKGKIRKRIGDMLEL